MRRIAIILALACTCFASRIRAQSPALTDAATSSARFDLARSLQREPAPPADIQRAALIYRDLITLTGDPYVRRAQMELGNLVLDNKYTSGDPKLDLFWARTITQELLGQEQYRLAFAHGSAMDLPSSPEVNALTVRTAASYNVDLAQLQMAERAPKAERAAWLRLGGQYFNQIQNLADVEDNALTPEERSAVSEAFSALLSTRESSGAFYRKSDPLRDPGQASLEALLAKGTDPDAQLRLAYYYERRATDPIYAAKAITLYRIVRDGRVSSVRFKIGAHYEQATEDFPLDPVRAAQWFGFAAKAASLEACTHILKLQAATAIPDAQATIALEGCPVTHQN